MIVDTHVHVGNKLDFSMPPETVLASMKKYKIDYSLVSSIDSTEADHLQRILPCELQTPQEESLEILLDFVKKNPDKIGAAVWVKPATEKLSKNFKKLILDNRDYIFAVKFHPFHSNVVFGGEETKAYIEFAAENGFPIVTHTAYHHNRKGEKSIYQDYFNKLPLLLGKEEYDMLMWKNAVDFFGLPLKK